MLSGFPEADNELVRRFLRLPGFSALGQPGALPVGRLATRMGATLAAAAGMRDGVHRLPANVGSNSKPTAFPGFPPDDIVPFNVSELSYRGPAPDVDFPDFAAGQEDVSVVPFPGKELGEVPGAPRQLAAAAGRQFHVMDHHAGRDGQEGHAVAGFRFHLVAADNLVADRNFHGREDIAAFPVLVFQEGDARTAVGIVLDGFDDF